MATSEIDNDASRLPQFENGSFSYLLKAYGWEDFSKRSDADKINRVADNPNSRNYNALLSPLYFVLGGYGQPNLGFQRYAGLNGRIRSTRASSSMNWSYLFSFDLDSVSPTNGWEKMMSFSLRF